MNVSKTWSNSTPSLLWYVGTGRHVRKKMHRPDIENIEKDKVGYDIFLSHVIEGITI